MSFNPALALREKYERINVGGTANVVKVPVQSGVKRVVFFSTIAVYGYSLGEILTEDAVPQPETLHAQTKLAAERIELGTRRFDGQPLGTVLPLGAVYGARRDGEKRAGIFPENFSKQKTFPYTLYGELIQRVARRDGF